MLSFAKSFRFKVEGMCLQHLTTLSLKGVVDKDDDCQEILGFNHQISYYTKTWRLTATTRIAGSYITK